MQVSLYATITYLKNVAQIKHTIPFENSVFPWGMTTSSYIVDD
jgi:hypothetical protein